MRKVFFNLHLYVALIVSLFILILSVTGAMAAFGPELDALFNPKLFHVDPQNTPPLPFQTLAGIVSRNFGERRPGPLIYGNCCARGNRGLPEWLYRRDPGDALTENLLGKDCPVP